MCFMSSFLKTKFLGIDFKNPLVLASGILGVTGDTLQYVVRCGAGGVTSKSVWREKHVGHPNPVMIANEHFMLNAVGLPDGGFKKAVEELGSFMEDHPAPLIMSIVGGKKSDFVAIAEKVDEINPDIVELNISCPNVEDAHGKPFACSVDGAADVTKEVRAKTKLPLIIKLSPNVPNIGAIAKACEDAGADGITAINTAGPGMVIDIDMRSPVLANKVGGISGPAIKPIAIKCVYDIFKSVKIPILGMGGVTSGRDAIEMMMAGASLVGMGTAVYYRGAEAFAKVAEEMEEWCRKEGVKNVGEIVGAAVK